MPFLIALLGIGGIIWYFSREASAKSAPQLPGSQGGPVPITAVPSEDIGLVLAYHGAMVNPGQHDSEGLKAIADGLFAQGYQYEGAQLINRAMGQQYPTEVLLYHDMMAGGGSGYTADDVMGTAAALDALGFNPYAQDLVAIAQNM